jgi:uncharacterized protein (DUF2141 family)
MFLIKLFIVFITLFQNSQNKTEGNLKINITNIKEKTGYIRVGLYNNPKDFPKNGKAYKNVSAKVVGNTATVSFNNIPGGNYAIALFHDENNDTECNLNYFGIPKEGIGFSNNIKPRTSAPDFQETMVVLKPKTIKTIEIKLIHY